MKHSLKLTASVVFAVCIIIYGCSKGHSTTGDTPTPAAGSANFLAHARLGISFSQPIPVDSANRMIESYIGSQGYPGTDNSLRSISIDADTLRAYLQDPRIVTVKFMLAHQQSFINAGGFKKNAGLSSRAMTMVMVGLDNQSQFVLNKSNGVYDHFSLCPDYCQVETDAYIH